MCINTELCSVWEKKRHGRGKQVKDKDPAQEPCSLSLAVLGFDLTAFRASERRLYITYLKYSLMRFQNGNLNCKCTNACHSFFRKLLGIRKKLSCQMYYSQRKSCFHQYANDATELAFEPVIKMDR